MLSISFTILHTKVINQNIIMSFILLTKTIDKQFKQLLPAKFAEVTPEYNNPFLYASWLLQ